MDKKILAKETIDRIFDDKENREQADIFIALMREIYPNWDEITELHGWPKCNQETWKYICKKFIEFDQTHHPDVIPGGLWTQRGFSGFSGLEDWEVIPAEYELVQTDEVFDE